MYFPLTQINLFNDGAFLHNNNSQVNNFFNKNNGLVNIFTHKDIFNLQGICQSNFWWMVELVVNERMPPSKGV